MRFSHVVLLAVVTIVASSEGVPTSTQTMITSPYTHHSPVIEEKETAVTRHLRTNYQDEKEERVSKELGDKIVTKLKKWVKYNTWIFGNKKPEWVWTNHPEFGKGFETFYNNRMVRGYKYA
ncbi:unnamed protein product [Phytophthora lilii]|uniref:RxLR effector protein n=1 Tax=Phytophthora lilii TaxID=2077276 RepID=A0A9W6U468_9STRA|nr:unnamed protein product [Phytophthora lilii]